MVFYFFITHSVFNQQQSLLVYPEYLQIIHRYSGFFLFCQQPAQVRKGLLNRAVDHRDILLFSSGDIRIGHIIHDHLDAPALDRRQLGNGLVESAILFLADQFINHVIDAGSKGQLINGLMICRKAVVYFALVQPVLFLLHGLPLSVEAVINGDLLVLSVVVFDFNGFHVFSSKSFKSFVCAYRTTWRRATGPAHELSHWLCSQIRAAKKPGICKCRCSA